ncbi:MAG: VanW family protein [Syntrophomonadaceae bacterium]|jgi:vancomycin resistance protein VanW
MKDGTAPIRPKHRSRLRLGLGKIYFTARRYMQWFFTKQKCAHTIDSNLLEYTISSHQTPLIRQLQKADMKLQYNKIANLHLAAARLDGLVVQPGETFSFWKLVGKPTRRKGYLEGMVLSNGRVCSGTGGGLCQLSNLIYWMTLHTPLSVTERWRHNYDVFPDSNRTQPFGSGATVVYNYIDLQITNNTESAYQLLVELDEHHLYGEWRSSHPLTVRYEVYEREHLIKAEWWGGYTRNNVLARKTFDLNGLEFGDEVICANQAIVMYPPVLP